VVTGNVLTGGSGVVAASVSLQGRGLTAFTTAGGAFQLDNVSAGSYTILIFSPAGTQVGTSAVTVGTGTVNVGNLTY
jgi:hypothetical protein